MAIREKKVRKHRKQAEAVLRNIERNFYSLEETLLVITSRLGMWKEMDATEVSMNNLVCFFPVLHDILARNHTCCVKRM